MATSTAVTLSRYALPAQLKRSNVTYTGAATNTLITAVASSYLRIWLVDLVLSGASTIEFLTGSTSFTQAMSFAANARIQYGFNPILPSTNATRAFPPFVCALEEDFKITTGSAITVSGQIWYEVSTTA